MDLKYLPDDIILIEKKGEENFIGCLCSIEFLEEHRYSVTAKVGDAEKETKLASMIKKRSK